MFHLFLEHGTLLVTIGILIFLKSLKGSPHTGFNGKRELKCYALKDPQMLMETYRGPSNVVRNIFTLSLLPAST